MQKKKVDIPDAKIWREQPSLEIRRKGNCILITTPNRKKVKKIPLTDPKLREAVERAEATQKEAQTKEGHAAYVTAGSAVLRLLEEMGLLSSPKPPTWDPTFQWSVVGTYRVT